VRPRAIMDRGRVLALDTLEGLIEVHGGRSVIRAELESAPADPAALGGTLDGLTLVIETRQPLEEVARLVQSGLKLTGLHVTRPNLETVFLELTGRSLRDQ